MDSRARVARGSRTRTCPFARLEARATPRSASCPILASLGSFGGLYFSVMMTPTLRSSRKGNCFSPDIFKREGGGLHCGYKIVVISESVPNTRCHAAARIKTVIRSAKRQEGDPRRGSFWSRRRRRTNKSRRDGRDPPIYIYYMLPPSPDRSLAEFGFAVGRLAGYVKCTLLRPQRSGSLLRKGELHF